MIVTASTSLSSDAIVRLMPSMSMVPSSSIIPVNIDVSFDGELVGRNLVNGDVVQLDRVRAAAPADAAGQRQRFQAAENFGAVVEEDAIHDAAFERAPVQLAAGF